jgi:hypothetical protein
MNNSKLTMDEFQSPLQEIDKTSWLRDREATLVRQIETLRRVAKSEDWCSLKKELFDGVVEILEKQQKSEAEKEKPDPLKLTNINGQLAWARKYSDLNKLADAFIPELNTIKKQLK